MGYLLLDVLGSWVYRLDVSGHLKTCAVSHLNQTAKLLDEGKGDGGVIEDDRLRGTARLLCSSSAAGEMVLMCFSF